MSRDPRSRRPVAALVSLLLVLSACAQRKDPTQQPDMLVVLVSGLRADRPGELGAEAALLAAFGDAPRRAFSQAYSQSISPNLALGSLLTGLYPSAIPQCGFADYRSPDLDAQPWCSALPSERTTLPQALEAYGWRTAFAHSGFLEQAAFEGRFGTEMVLPANPKVLTTSWPALEEQVLGWWGVPDQPRLLVLMLPDLMATLPPERGGGSLSDSPVVPPSYPATAGAIGLELAGLIERLERASKRPLLVVISSPHGIDHQVRVAPRANVTQRMSLALLEERTLHVPLVLLGSDVTSSARFEPQVELRAVLPTLLGRVEAALPAGVKARDLLSSDPAQHGEGLAYSEVGDMLTLCRGHWMLRFRTMVHHGTALNTDLTTFLMFPPERALSEQKRTRTYMLFNLEDVSPPLLDRARTDWSEALDLREAMIRLRTGPAEPHPRTLDPERLLELRMIASDGYW